MSFATGKYAKAQCDRCGCMVKYRTLKAEYRNNKRTGLMVCRDCFDPQHPQDNPRKHIPDPIALRNPRPRNEITDPNDVNNSAFAPPEGVSYEEFIRNGGMS